MEAKFTDESYSLVLKMATKFAYGNKSLNYEEYVSIGTEGLIKAINNYREDSGVEFSTFANTCIRNAMCTKKKNIERFDLQQDENVEMETIDTLSMEMVDDDMEDVFCGLVRNANNGNERNTEMVLLHLGIGAEESMDYKELSAKFNVSAERVRQVYVNTMSTIAHNPNAKELLYSFVG